MSSHSSAQKLAIEQGLSLLRDGAFFAAHECFEAAWRTHSGASRTLFHGLAQLAASYHQLSLGRARAAVRTWSKASDKLAAIGALSPAFREHVTAFFARLGIDETGPRFVDRARLPPPDAWPMPDEPTLVLGS